MADPSAPPAAPLPRVPPALERAAAVGWRALVVLATAAVAFSLIGRLWVISLAGFIALLLTRILIVPAAALRRRGWPAGLACGAAMFGFFALLGLVGVFTGMGVAGQAGEVGPTILSAVDDVQDWLVNDAPFEFDQANLTDIREQATDAIGGLLSSSGGPLLSGALQAFEFLLSLLLALILTFFMIKDGDIFLAWMRRRVKGADSERAARLSGRAWETLGGYLRGAALLGLVEGLVIGVTLQLVGAELAIPMALLTFAAAFIPFAGAIVAGVLASLVALATAGTTAAVIVVVVAVVVQQLDNDLLAPVIYGRALNLHPVWILIAIAGGGALFGLAGTIAAVPVAAVVINVMSEHVSINDERTPPLRGPDG